MRMKCSHDPWKMKVDIPTPDLTLHELFELLFAQMDYDMMLEVAEDLQCWILKKDWPR